MIEQSFALWFRHAGGIRDCCFQLGEISMSSSESALVMSSFSTSDWYRAQELQLPIRIIEHDSGSCWSLSGANGRSCGLVSCSAGCAYGAEGGYAVGWLAAVIAVIFCI